MPGLPIPLAQGVPPAQLTLSASATAGGSLRFATSGYAATLFGLAGLRGYWPLNEASGATARDLAGVTAEDAAYAGSGVTLGQTAVVTGAGTAARFDGATGEAVTPAVASEIDVANTFTAVLWLARERTGSEQLLHKGSGGLGIRFDSTNHVEVYQVDVGILARSTTTITDTAAHMIAVTKTGTTTKIYVDNVDVTNPVADSTVSATTGALAIAGSP